jgi:hypothetical protein
MSIPKTLSRTPTMVSDHSDTVSKAKPLPRSSDGSSIHPEKVIKPGTPQQGMVAPLQLSRWRFWAIFISLMISIFLFALGMSSTLSVDGRLTCRPTYPRYCYPQNHRSLQLPYRIIMARFRFLVRLLNILILGLTDVVALLYSASISSTLNGSKSSLRNMLSSLLYSSLSSDRSLAV